MKRAQIKCYKAKVNSQGLTLVMVAMLSVCAVADQISFPYKAKVAKVTRRGIRAELASQSMAVRLQDSPPATVAQLRRRADADIISMAAVLQSHGYYNGVVEYDINTNKTPAILTFKPKLNERYLFRAVSIKYVEEENSSSLPPVIKVLLKKDAPAVASAVIFEEARLLRQVKRKGYPFAQLVERIVTIDKDSKSIDVTFMIKTGAIATFGDVAISGEERVNSRYIRRRISWRKGDLYDIRDVADFEQDLLVSGLFNTAKVSHGDSLDDDGSLSMSVEVKERQYRTVRVGASYRSDVGVGGIISWEHRNLFHGAESFGYTLAVSEIERFQRLQFTRPDFLSRNLSLLIATETMYETPDAYSSRSYEGSVTLEYKVGRYSTVDLGLVYKTSFVEQFDSGEDYDLVSVPLSLERDTRDDQLDTKEGWRAIFLVEPFRDVRNDDSFVRYLTEDRGYLLLSKKRSFVLAGRVLIGSIHDANREDVPADERFYAGGGGSVRGYEYQMVGDVTTNGVPVGGLSLFEVSAEVRVRPGEKIGYVLFVDGGMSFGESLLDASESLLWGAGVGLRYNIGFAPLRVDFAVPLNKRSGIDENFQFYISIGQAF